MVKWAFSHSTAPSRTVLLCTSGALHLVLIDKAPACPYKSIWGAWAPQGRVPCLLLRTATTVVTFFNDLGHPLAVQDVGICHRGCRGQQGVVIAGYDNLKLYTVEGHTRILCHSIASPSHVTPVCSPDGLHVLAQAFLDTLIIAFASGAVQSWRQAPAKTSVYELCWPRADVIRKKL